MLIFEAIFTSKMANGETTAVTSRKYVAKKGMNNSKSFKKYEVFWSHSSVFALD